jgi:hypothetical protein
MKSRMLISPVSTKRSKLLVGFAVMMIVILVPATGHAQFVPNSRGTRCARN